MSDDAYRLPEGPPAPVDDGACDGLVGKKVPSLVLESSRGPLDIAVLAAGRLVLYVYPRAGREERPEWDLIPGARGCTPQACSFRDHSAELSGLGALVAGVSAQSLDEQVAFAERNHMPFPIVADDGLRLRDTLGLPTFEVDGDVLYKRVTLVAEGGVIVKVFYPVFPPDRNAADVIAWLRAR
ncbi:MAG: peroxiredoxin [Gaiellaceae bacterium]